MGWRFSRKALTASAVAAADVVVVLTPHAEIDWDLVVGSARLVLDTRGTLPVGAGVHRL